MRATVRASTAAVAVIFGFLSGSYISHAGGSPGRALTAALMMAVVLSGTGLAIGVPLGVVNDGPWVKRGLALMLASYCVSGLLNSPFRSLVVDLLFLTVSFAPACIFAPMGFATGQRNDKR
ncbi:hypothetical protein [Micromonospora narathiwatensis]|nr:hypothetical protein [Micromonospora narathiwatensis]